MAELYGWDVYSVSTESYTVTEPVQKSRTVTKYRDEYVDEEYWEAEYGAGWEYTESMAENAALVWSMGADKTGTFDVLKTVNNDGNPVYLWDASRYRRRTRKVKKRVPYDDVEYYTVDEQVTKYRNVKGRFVKSVTSDDRYKYPVNGKQGWYRYVYTGVANHSPVIYGPADDIGKVHGDFEFRYTVRDEDNDSVKVNITVDGTQVLYPTTVTLGVEQKQTIRLADYSYGLHTIVISADDGKGGTASKTYTFNKSNSGPTISGYDSSLGAKNGDFNVEYVIQDADGDVVKVEIQVDGKTVQRPTATTLGVKKYFKVDISDLGLGTHRVTIIATDEPGEEARRVYRFEKANNAPKISGTDTNLGAKNMAFSYSYSVTDEDGGPVKVVERFNGKVLSVKENISLGKTYTITISNEQIQALELNKVSTIEIEASDEYTTTYRRVTFARSNTPPIISGTDKNYGEVTESFTYSFSATDPDRDKIYVTVYLDNKILRQRRQVTDGETIKLSFDHAQRIRLKPGSHTIRVEAEDDKGFSSERVVTFERIIKRIVVELANKGIPTDMLAKRLSIVATGVHVDKADTVKYEACNNSFDAKPTREDATEATLQERAYIFSNQTKTANQAGINIRVTITRGAGSRGTSYLTAIGGSYD